MTTLATTGNTQSNNQTAQFLAPEASIEQVGRAHDSIAITHDDAIIRRALKILEHRARYGEVLSSPKAAGDFCRLKLAGLEHEVFAVLMLDAQNRLISYEELFRGTLTQTSVYPREVVKAALACNAAGVILSHNHPSGLSEPSRADEVLTQTLKQALALIDVRVLDHLIVATGGIVSLAERGII
jgi:DNA repair protein RadC